MLLIITPVQDVNNNGTQPNIFLSRNLLKKKVNIKIKLIFMFIQFVNSVKKYQYVVYHSKIMSIVKNIESTNGLNLQEYKILCNNLY